MIALFLIIVAAIIFAPIIKAVGKAGIYLMLILIGVGWIGSQFGGSSSTTASATPTAMASPTPDPAVPTATAPPVADNQIPAETTTPVPIPEGLRGWGDGWTAEDQAAFADALEQRVNEEERNKPRDKHVPSRAERRQIVRDAVEDLQEAINEIEDD
jgi:hypothetical protein